MESPGFFTVLRHPGTHSLDALRYLLLAVLLVLMPLLSRGYGITWDENVQQMYGEYVYNYFASGFHDLTARSFHDLWLYGGMFDLLCVTVQKVFAHIDPFDIRHMINALFGWGCLAATGMLARRAFGPGAGLLAVVLLVLTPRFFGHAMNNPKDVPFALFHTLALFHLAGARAQWPFFSKRTLLGVVLCATLAVNVRVGGLLVVGYGGLLTGVLILLAWKQMTPARLATAAVAFVVCTALIMALGTAFWPWAQVNPFLRLPEALAAASKFPWQGSVLFDAAWVKAASLPWTYLPTWFCITTPLAVLAGAALAPVMALADRREIPSVVFLIFPALFPVAYVIYKGSTLYDGLRHMLFVLPLLAVLAAGTWSKLVAWAARLPRPSLRLAGQTVLLACVAGMLANPLAYSIRAHPYQSVFFNPLIGDLRGAFLRYEADYWHNSFREAIDWVRSKGKPGAPATFTVLNGDLFAPWLYARRFPEVAYLPRTEEHYTSARYFLVLLRGDPDQVRQMLAWPDVAYRVEADGVPLCIVLERPNRPIRTPDAPPSTMENAQ